MKLFLNYQEIKNKYKKDAYDVFTDYVAEVITLKERRQIRKEWNKLRPQPIWEDFLINKANCIILDI
tara:strand:- start:9147 stop:9347 length:201 start_codon:yes stop_codon:yes gene_type:complete